jgi:hypothetical protein
MQLETVKTFEFDELSSEVQQQLIDDSRDSNVDYDWWDYTYDDFREACKLMGFTIDKIYFSGFSSQGDGACFTGTYQYKKGSVRSIKDFSPQCVEFNNAALDLYELQKPLFYQFHASVHQSGRYVHENTMHVETERLDGIWIQDGGDEAEAFLEICKTLARYLYKRLEAEYNHYRSDEYGRERLSELEVMYLKGGAEFFKE